MLREFEPDIASNAAEYRTIDSSARLVRPARGYGQLKALSFWSPLR
jgi:hypothetical protein